MNTNFRDPSYLQSGNDRQQQAFDVLRDLKVYEVLRPFDPLLTGTIAIDISTSDLDIICEFHNEQFKSTVKAHFGNESGFIFRHTRKQGHPTQIANFEFTDFQIEIFGQPIPVIEHMANRHMIKEYQILNSKDEAFRLQVIKLKQQGLSTEAAFAKLLNTKGNPYLGLLEYKAL